MIPCEDIFRKAEGSSYSPPPSSSLPPPPPFFFLLLLLLLLLFSPSFLHLIFSFFTQHSERSPANTKFTNSHRWRPPFNDGFSNLQSNLHLESIESSNTHQPPTIFNPSPLDTHFSLKSNTDPSGPFPSSFTSHHQSPSPCQDSVPSSASMHTYGRSFLSPFFLPPSSPSPPLFPPSSYLPCLISLSFLSFLQVQFKFGSNSSFKKVSGRKRIRHAQWANGWREPSCQRWTFKWFRWETIYCAGIPEAEGCKRLDYLFCLSFGTGLNHVSYLGEKEFSMWRPPRPNTPWKLCQRLPESWMRME